MACARCLVLAGAVVTLGLIAGLPHLPAAHGQAIEGRYIVVYDESAIERPGAATASRERRYGFQSTHRYRAALEGFAARLDRRQARAIARDPAVAFVEPDRRVEATENVALAPGEELPTGARRIGAATPQSAREQSAAGVAVLDTGIDLDHPDLDAVDGTDCIDPGTPASDEHGHGTHVAGTIGARNQGSGMVGVAPGTEVYAVRVLDQHATGSFSQVACGIDWVTANHEAEGIAVANMSLGGTASSLGECETTTNVMHIAICASTAAGVSYVVAAGNDGWDFDSDFPDVPAAFPEVLTVTAFSDSDGEPGGAGGPPECRQWEGDDEPAQFSNFAATAAGEAHTVAAPGVCINSTHLGGGHRLRSGTSMATPHVAGLVALCYDEAGTVGECAGKTTDEVIDHVREAAEQRSQADPDFGFESDPLHSPAADTYYGYALGASLIDTTPPETAIDEASLIEATNQRTPTFTFSADEPGSSFECKAEPAPFTPCSGPGGSHTTEELADGEHTFSVRARDPAGNRDPTPPSHTFAVDATPPVAAITSNPHGITRETTLSFTFSADKDPVTFECRLSGAPFAPCSGPGASHTASGLPDGEHTFEVRATDGLGNVSQLASEQFTVDTRPPVTRIDSGPAESATVSEDTVTFTYSADEPTSAFECRLGSAAFEDCTAPASFTASDLADGPHTFSVRATDLAGNTDPTPAGRAFTVDTTPPKPPDDEPPSEEPPADSPPPPDDEPPSDEPPDDEPPADSPPPADSNPPLGDGPALELAASSPQRLRRSVAVRVSCAAEACAIVARGRLRIRGLPGLSATAAQRRKALRLRVARTRLAAGQAKRLRLRVTPRGQRLARRALRRDRRVIARVNVIATADSGGSQRQSVRVRLRRGQGAATAAR